MMEVSVPSIGGSFHSGRNFTLARTARSIIRKHQSSLRSSQRIHFNVLKWLPILTILSWIRPEQSLSKRSHSAKSESDPETAKQAMDNVQEAKRLLALTRKEHLKDIRQLELDKTVEFFDRAVRSMLVPQNLTRSITSPKLHSVRLITTAATSNRTWTNCEAKFHDTVASRLVRNRSLQKSYSGHIFVP